MRCPGCKSRLAPLRVSELRDTGHPRPDQAEDAALWANLGIGSVLMIGYCIEGRPAGVLGIAGAQAARQLGGAAASADEARRARASRPDSSASRSRRILRDLEERNELALYSANDGLWDFDTLEQPGLSVAALEGDARLR